MGTTAPERRSALLRTGRRLTVAAATLAVVGTAATAATAPPASAGPPQWTIQGTTNPAGANANNVLLAVSCPSATACLAVGFGKTRHVGTAMAESWNGTSWTTTPSAAPPGASQSDLRAVSCTSATACTAVGFYRDISGTQHDLAERWDGSSWTVQSAPDPAAIQRPLERGGHKYAQVPSINQLRAQEEHAVKEQHRVRGGRRHRLGQSGVRTHVVDRVLVSPVAARAQRIE